MINLEDLLTADQAAERLGVTRQRVYALTKAGAIGRRVGTTWLYTKQQLDEWKAAPKSKGGRPKRYALRPMALRA